MPGSAASGVLRIAEYANVILSNGVERSLDCADRGVMNALPMDSAERFGFVARIM